MKAPRRPAAPVLLQAKLLENLIIVSWAALRSSGLPAAPADRSQRPRRREGDHTGCRRPARLDLLAAAVCAAGASIALGTGCATFVGAPAMSIQEERRLGREARAEVEQAMEISRDPVVVNYIRGLGQRLVTANTLEQFDYTFDVVDDPRINAFAIPGGHLYVNTGLICAADTEAELAGVIGHELGHAAERHAVQQMTAQQQTEAAALGGAALLSILLGYDPGQVSPAVAVPATLAAQGFLLKYSRDQEREADRLAVRYLHEAGYDPFAVPSFFEELKAREPGEPGALAALLSSHPVTSDRIEATRAEAAKYGSRPQPRSGAAAGQPEGRLAEVQAHLDCEQLRRRPPASGSGAGDGASRDAGVPAPGAAARRSSSRRSSRAPGKSTPTSGPRRRGPASPTA